MLSAFIRRHHISRRLFCKILRREVIQRMKGLNQNIMVIFAFGVTNAECNLAFLRSCSENQCRQAVLFRDPRLNRKYYFFAKGKRETTGRFYFACVVSTRKFFSLQKNCQAGGSFGLAPRLVSDLRGAMVHHAFQNSFRARTGHFLFSILELFC